MDHILKCYQCQTTRGKIHPRELAALWACRTTLACSSVRPCCSWFLQPSLPVRQKATAAKPTAPFPMPVDRASDSYRIYRVWTPLGETAGKAWPHKLWLVQNTTVTVISPDEPCQVKPTSQPDAASLLSMGMNPHVAVRPSDDRRQDVEILKDWDGHCHDRILLDPNAWHTSVPVRLLNPAAQERYRASRTNAHRNSNTDNFSDAPALYGFSEVFFELRTHRCIGVRNPLLRKALRPGLLGGA